MAFGEVLFTIEDPEKRERVVALFEKADAHYRTIKELSEDASELRSTAWALVEELAGAKFPFGRICICDTEGRLIDQGPAPRD